MPYKIIYSSYLTLGKCAEQPASPTPWKRKPKRVCFSEMQNNVIHFLLFNYCHNKIGTNKEKNQVT
jgi:hypothetical protein